MSSDALKGFILASKYASWNEASNHLETREEAFDRVLDMHRQRYAGIDIEAELAFARDAMRDGLVLGSQRALQFGGPAILRKHARIYNCTTSYCDRPRFFQECLWLLLCGCGTGFSVQRHHVAKLPDIAPRRANSETVCQVDDTIEGWADALGVLMASYGVAAPGFEGWKGLRVLFDLSRIRPAGSKLSSGMGTAPGPAPLDEALKKIEALLEGCVAAGQTRLEPIDCYDIVMHASDAVLAGGVRRSATICLFSKDDRAMATAKTGDWYVRNPQRGRSNNSAVLLRDDTTREEFAALMASVKSFGEPGFVWASSTEIMYNPCVEIGLYPAITRRDLHDLLSMEEVRESGLEASGDPDELVSGWAFCNLCEINMAAVGDLVGWERAARAAAILGTLQAGYTRFGYLTPVSEAIARREALLGVSMTGIMDNPDLALQPALQQRVASLVVSVNEAFAPKVGVRPTARATCVKPAGTTSLLLGTASGIHAHHSRRYFRRVQGNVGEPCVAYFAAHNPQHTQVSVWGDPSRARSLIFAVEAPPLALTKSQVDAVQQLRYVQLTQQNWVAAGRVAGRCAAPFLSHNVSNTINVAPGDWDAVEEFIYANRADFAGISLLSTQGDLDYPQAPMCRVLTAQEIIDEYGDGALMGSGLIVDGLHAFGDLWAACACALGHGEVIDTDRLREAVAAAQGTKASAPWDAEGIGPRSSKKMLLAWLRHTVVEFDKKTDWVRRAKKFAANYFGGDLVRMTYCLKDLSNFKLWIDLARAYQPVDWSLMPRPAQVTNKVSDAACAGGACEII